MLYVPRHSLPAASAIIRQIGFEMANFGEKNFHSIVDEQASSRLDNRAVSRLRLYI